MEVSRLALGHALRVERRSDDRVVAGVAAGLAARVGLDPLAVRVAAVLLGLASGVGVVGYLLLWALSTPPSSTSPSSTSPPSALIPSSAPAGSGFRSPTIRQRSQAETYGALLMVFAVLLVLRELGFWPAEELMWPAIALGAGAVAVSVRGGSIEPWLDGPRAKVRLIAGALFMLLGLGVVVGRGSSFNDIRRAFLAAVFALAGAAAVFGPLVTRLARESAQERRERIRQDERARVANHLHDSVLQTLALIQRSAGDPRRTVTLARRQERELRSWLYGAVGEPDRSAGSLSTTMAEIVEALEGDHDVEIDSVVVGDAAANDNVRALTGALREAMVNAAKHSGEKAISVYVEVEPGEISAFVRDRGKGFDLALVPSDRRGIADSIRSRVQRVGGSADVTSAPGEGTEVRLRVPMPGAS